MGKKTLLYLSLDDVVKAGALNMKKAVEDIENVFSLYERNEYFLPQKVVLRWGGEETEFSTGRINGMPGYIGGEYDMAGIKWIGSNPENPFKHNLPRASALTVLNDPATKLPIAVMDGTVISAMRTGAATGVAAKYLARENSSVLCLIGAGVQNRTQMKAVLAVCPNVSEVFVYDIDFGRAQKFAEETSASENIKVTPLKEAKEGVCKADVIVTATMATAPIVEKDWIQDGCFFANVAGYEYTFDALKSADKIVVDRFSEIIHRKHSTLALMVIEGLLSEKDVYASLGEVVNKKKQGRETPEERIYFNSVGMGIEDIAIAARIYREAKKSGLGVELPLWENPLWI